MINPPYKIIIAFHRVNGYALTKNAFYRKNAGVFQNQLTIRKGGVIPGLTRIP